MNKQKLFQMFLVSMLVNAILVLVDDLRDAAALNTEQQSVTAETKHIECHTLAQIKMCYEMQKSNA